MYDENFNLCDFQYLLQENEIQVLLYNIIEILYILYKIKNKYIYIYTINKKILEQYVNLS